MRPCFPKQLWMIPALVAGIVVASFADIARTQSTPDASYLSDLEKEVLHEHNLARTNPAQYAKYVAEWLKYYKGKKKISADWKYDP